MAITVIAWREEKRREGKGREGKGREGKGREGKGREGKGREGKGREGKGREGKGREGKGREGKGREGKGREGKGREGKGREGKGREGKGREGKGREGKYIIFFFTMTVLTKDLGCNGIPAVFSKESRNCVGNPLKKKKTQTSRLQKVSRNENAKISSCNLESLSNVQCQRGMKTAALALVN